MSQTVSFNVRIRRLLCVVGVAGFCLAFLIGSLYETGQQKKEVAVTMRGAANSCSALLRDYLLQHERYIEQIIARLPPGNDASVARYFSENLPMLGPLDNYFVLDANGVVLQTSRGHESFVGIDFSHLEHLSSGQAISRVHQSLVSLKPVVSLQYSLGDGRRLLIEKDLNSIAPLVGHLQVRGGGIDTVVFILSASGTIVYHPDSALLASRYPLGFELKNWTEPDKYGLETYDFHGSRFIAYRQPLNPPQGWTFYAISPERALVRLVVGHLLGLAAIIALFFTLFIWFLDYLIRHRLSAPITQIAEKLSSLNPLDSGNLPLYSSEGKTAEIAQIVEATNRMAANVRLSNEKLMEREELFRTVTEFAMDWTFWLSPEQSLIYVSPSCQAITGYGPEDFYSRPELMQEIVYSEDKQFCLRHFSHAAGGEAHDPMRYRIITKDGDLRWMSHVCRGIYDGDNNFLGVRGSNSDITASVLAEQTLRESEERFRALIEQASDGIFVHDFAGRIIEVNQQASDMLGYTREELLSMRVRDIEAGVDPEKCGDVWNRVRSGLRQTIEGRHRRKDGTEYSVEAQVGMVQWRGEKMVLALVRDITWRKEAEDRLAAEKELLGVTLRSIGDGVITTDYEGRVVMMSRVAEGLTGWPQEEAAGRAIEEVFHLVDKRSGNRLETPINKVIETGQIVGLASHTMLVGRDGTERMIADSGAPIRDRESKIIGVVLVFRDITEEQRLELEAQKAQKLESLGVLAGGIAHDFNNLLTAILGNISFVRLELPGDIEAQKKLDAAERASIRAQGLTQQLLTFAKGGAPVKEVITLSQVIQDAVSFGLRGSNVKPEIDIVADLRPVEVDPGQISQVLNNLIINSDQAMPDGGLLKVVARNVHVGAGNAQSLLVGDYVKIVIADQGCGIAPDHLDKIFDPYFTTKKAGSGLGLASCYSIMKRHGGHIAVSSTLGIGTTVTLYLPVAIGGTSSESLGTLEQVHKGKGRVMVMDDEEMVRNLAGDVLTALGYDALMAEDGAAALALYQQHAKEGHPVDAVIMDLTIPGGMGGKEAIAELLKIDPAAKVIVSSGYAQDPIMADYKKYGFAAVLAKPYSIQKLSAVLKTLIAD